MKYTIEGFSQAKLVELKLNAVDALILRWYVDFLPNMTTIDFNGKRYTWVKYSAVIADLPSIEITNNQVIARRFDKFVNAGIMEKHVERNGGNFTCFRLTEEYLSLVDGSTLKSAPSTQKSIGIDSKVDTPIDSKVDTKDSSIKKTHLLNNFSAAPAHGNINATPASQNIKPNFKTKTSDDLREMAWLAWQETIKQKKIPFTEFELSAIKAYAYSKPTMPAYEIESNLVLLDKWTVEGLDIENSLRQSLSTKALIRPAMRIECDSRNNRIYSIEQLNNVRNNQIQREQQGQGAA